MPLNRPPVRKAAPRLASDQVIRSGGCGLLEVQPAAGVVTTTMSAAGAAMSGQGKKRPVPVASTLLVKVAPPSWLTEKTSAASPPSPTEALSELWLSICATA